MATDKYSKRPGRARKRGGFATLTDAHVTIKPRFCVALIALALAGGSAGPSFAQSMSGGGANPNASRTTLDPIPEGGWEGLANVLKAVQPGVDTRLTPTASQVTDHIERLLNRGDNATALDMIEKRLAETKGQRGTDVQLMFQHARALAALHRTAEAIDVYTEMTTSYPELPEPWNNLAALYAGRGEWKSAGRPANGAARRSRLRRGARPWATCNCCRPCAPTSRPPAMACRACRTRPAKSKPC